MAELPEELLSMIKQKWTEIQIEGSKAKKPKIAERCDNCQCYKCCQHVWVCGKCGVEKESFHKWTEINRSLE